MAEKSDPTKDQEFQKVIRHFVTTPHKPHAPLKTAGKRGIKASSKKRKQPPKGEK